MPKNERLARALQDHLALIRDAVVPQEAILTALAGRLCEAFQREGRLFICASGPMTVVADLTANLFLYRLGFERPALPVISLCHDATLLYSLSRDGLARQIFSRQLRPIAAENDILLLFSDLHPDPALNEALHTAERIGMTTAAVAPAKIALAGEVPPQIFFRLESSNPGRIVETAVVFAHLLCELVEAELFEH
jgi:D-sedoheptulose 7-phosphate isomerase